MKRSNEVITINGPEDVFKLLLEIIPDFSSEREENGLDYSKPLPPLQGPMPKAWYEKKAANDAYVAAHKVTKA